MKLVDAIALLYAVNSDAPLHPRSQRWLDGALSGEDTVAFSWVALLAFIRLATKIDLFPAPLNVDQAMDRVDAWLGADASVLLQQTAHHGAIVRSLLSSVGVGGNLVNMPISPLCLSNIVVASSRSTTISLGSQPSLGICRPRSNSGQGAEHLSPSAGA